MGSLEPFVVSVVELGFFGSIHYYWVVFVILGNCGNVQLSGWHCCFFHLFNRDRKSSVNKVSHDLAIYEKADLVSFPRAQPMLDAERQSRKLTDGDLVALESFRICDRGGLGMGEVPMMIFDIRRLRDKALVTPTRCPRNRSESLLMLAPDCRGRGLRPDTGKSDHAMS
jgi:hypothetical protein